MKTVEQMREAQREQQRLKDVALEGAVESRKKLLQAQKDYEYAILKAHTMGVTNMKMAREFGVSETSVRLYVKRHLTKFPDGVQ